MRSFICPKTGVQVNVPILPPGLTSQQAAYLQEQLLAGMVAENRIEACIAWYYTPMARHFSSFLRPRVTVYDCMDELSAFAGAPPAMGENERALFRDADLVFTGGASLFESKRRQHPAVYLFPSSVDVAHFARARSSRNDPEDQAPAPYPRIGYAGVIDERMDLELIAKISEARADWHVVMLGPVAKIDPASLPKAPNIHYLGMKSYAQLPDYFAGWEIGLLPFALNDSTRFISPTKTPEYLAAGLRVVSTPIRDVVSPYGDLGLVSIAQTAGDFISAIKLLLDSPSSPARRDAIDAFLSKSSWDQTWREMNNLIEERIMFRSTSGHRKPLPLTKRLAKDLTRV
ncbi:MAG: glycosyltransferase [Acidobacteriaceae bacterium]|nr:glycosyltransferase [Acidobacteriaceae bacterium]